MNKRPKTIWDERYEQTGYVYGTQPNAYLKEKLNELPTGRALFPAEGEGRNAVYAAELGWNTYAFDQSAAGKVKALQLAEQRRVLLDYDVSDIKNASYTTDSFDLIAFVYAHFPEHQRRLYHRKLTSFLKPGGALILEGFSKEHQENQAVNARAGGPRNLEMLFDLEELKADFHEFDFVEAYEGETQLNEGSFHQGKAHVVRLLATKQNNRK